MAQLRPFDFRYTGLLHRQAGGGGGAGTAIGGVHWSVGAPVIGGQTYEDALVPPSASRTHAGNPALAAVSGNYTGGVLTPNANQTAAAANITSTNVWNGQLYGVAVGGAVRKRASSSAAYGSTLWTVAYNRSRLLVAESGPQTRMLHTGYNATFDTAFITTCRDDTTRSASVSVGGTFDGSNTFGNATWRLFEAAPNNLLALVLQGASLLRSTTDGNSWFGVGGALDSPAVRLWCGIWRNANNNIHMIAHQMALATSTDNGVSWTVNASVPGATGTINVWNGGGGIENNQIEPCLVFDYTNRVGLILNSAGTLLSFNMDNPSAGYTVVTTGFQNGTGTGMTNTSLLFATAKAFFTFGISTATKPGLWYNVKGFPLTEWRQAAPASRFPAGFTTQQYASRVGTELGDGRFEMPLHAGGANASTNPMAIHLADMVTQFDRYIIADPLLPSGRKPFVRVA